MQPLRILKRKQTSLDAGSRPVFLKIAVVAMGLVGLLLVASAMTAAAEETAILAKKDAEAAYDELFAIDQPSSTKLG